MDHICGRNYGRRIRPRFSVLWVMTLIIVLYTSIIIMISDFKAIY